MRGIAFRVSDEARREVERLVGMQVTGVAVALFDVTLTLTSVNSRWVQINKAFQFRLGDEGWRGCDPAAAPGGGLTGDSEFVRLVGRTCDRAVLTDEEMVLTFAEGGAVCVGFGPADVEPVHLRGDGPGEEFMWMVW